MGPVLAIAHAQYHFGIPDVIRSSTIKNTARPQADMDSTLHSLLQQNCSYGDHTRIDHTQRQTLKQCSLHEALMKSVCNQLLTDVSRRRTVIRALYEAATRTPIIVGCPRVIQLKHKTTATFNPYHRYSMT